MVIKRKLKKRLNEVRNSRKEIYKSKFFQIAFFILIIVFSGCKAKKVTTESYIRPDTDKIASPGNQSNYNSIERVWFKKISGTYKSGESEVKFKANIRLVKDSIIIMSISSNMGIEGLRVILRPDSVTIQNRLKTRYYSDKIANLPKGRVKLWSFDLIQDILLMNANGIFAVDFNDKKFKYVDKKNSICYVNDDADIEVLKVNNQFVNRETCFDKGTGLINIGSLDYSEWSENILVQYIEYQKVENTFLPGNIDLQSKYRDTSTILKIELGKITLNTFFPAKVKISSKYKRVFSPDEI